MYYLVTGDALHGGFLLTTGLLHSLSPGGRPVIDEIQPNNLCSTHEEVEPLDLGWHSSPALIWPIECGTNDTVCNIRAQATKPCSFPSHLVGVQLPCKKSSLVSFSM